MFNKSTKKATTVLVDIHDKPKETDLIEFND